MVTGRGLVAVQAGRDVVGDISQFLSGTIKDPQSAQAAPLPHRLLPHLPHPALELQVREEIQAGGGTIELSLIAQDSAGETVRERFEPIVFRNNPGQLAAQWFKRLHGNGGTAVRHGALMALGAELGEQLLPRELRHLLAEHVGAERTLWVLSDEPAIPWELVRPPEQVGHERRSLPFLCESFAMTRWVLDREPVLSFPLRKIGVLVPEERGAIAAKEELDLLRSLPGREVVVLEPRLPAILDALAGGELDGLHFCGHALPPDGDPNLAGIPLADRQWLTPQSLAGNVGRFAARRPLVFLNGCHTGRSGFTLTRMGGWAAKFLELGAGAFVGCSWAVHGPTALKIAEQFYDSFLGGSSLGHALRQARLQPGLECPLTPWAYVAHGHPQAKVLPGGASGQ